MTNLTLEDLARASCASDSADIGSDLFDIHWREFGDAYLSQAKAILDRIQETHRIVPIEPTEAMLLNAGKSPAGFSPRGGTDLLGRMLPKYYRAMINASPIIGEKG